MIKRVKEFLDINQINNCRILVALSGGPDSVSLLYLLNQLKIEYKLDLEAAYVNHGMRPSDENHLDYKLVNNHCDSLNIKLHVHTILQGEIDREVQKTKRSSEAIAREIRYNFFNSIISKNTFIAIGHNRDDQIESMVMRFFQGSSIEGLIGIKSINGNIIRPLFNIEKHEVLKYLEVNNIKYNIDKTNTQNDFLRNKVRNILIPNIKDIFPGYKNALNRVEKELDFAKNTINDVYPPLEWLKVTDSQYHIDIDDILKLPFEIRKKEIYNIYDKILKGKVKDFRLPERFLYPLKSLNNNNKTVLDGYGCILISKDNKLILNKKNSVRHFSIRVFKEGEYKNSKNTFLINKSYCKSQLVPNLSYPFIMRSAIKGNKEFKILKKMGISGINYDNIVIIEKDTKIVAIFSRCKIIYNKGYGEEGICLEIK